jgi:hypothetical protein
MATAAENPEIAHALGNINLVRYEQKPEINCCYHNTNDPRVCVCATDRAECGKSVCVANLGTTGGKCICVSVVLLCVLFPSVFQFLLPLFYDDETTRYCIDKHSDCMAHSSYGEQAPRQICSGDSEHTIILSGCYWQ